MRLVLLVLPLLAACQPRPETPPPVIEYACSPNSWVQSYAGHLEYVSPSGRAVVVETASDLSAACPKGD